MSQLDEKCPKCRYPLEKHCKHIGLTEEQENQYLPCEYCMVKEENERLRAVLEMRDRGHEALRKAAQKLMDACYVIGWNLLPMSLLHDFQAVKEALVGAGPLEGRSLIDNEILADLYIRLSGKTRHASDCATSVAPADTPGPCDCNVPEPAALTPAAPETPTHDYLTPADEQLVEQMCVAFSAVKGNDMTRCMTAAMQVCLSSRNLVDIDDVDAATQEIFNEHPDAFGIVDHDWFIKNLRARLKPGPAKQRVTVGATNGHWIVYQDGLEVFHLDKGRYTKLGAERYANGLRAEIAEKGKAE